MTQETKAQAVLSWLFDDRAEHPLASILAFIGLCLLVSVAVTAAIAIPVEKRNQELAAQCESIGAEPVRSRAWVKFCELPDGTIVGIPGRDAL